MELLITLIIIAIIVYMGYVYKNTDDDVVGPLPVQAVVEVSGKPIDVYYNNRLIAYRDGIPYDSVSNTPFVQPVTEVMVILRDQAPYELKVNYPYTAMKMAAITGGATDILFDSYKTFHPGNQFVVRRPLTSVRMYS